MIRKYLLMFIIGFTSFKCYSDWNVLPDQTININANYDLVTRQISNLTATGSAFIDVSVVGGNQIRIRHGRDGYVGSTVPRSNGFRYNRDSRKDNKRLTLIGRSTNYPLPVDVGRGESQIVGIPTSGLVINPISNGCFVADDWPGLSQEFTMIVRKTVSVYADDYCIGPTYFATTLRTYTFSGDGGQIGFVERYFRFRNDFSTVPFDVYSGTYESHPTADVIQEGILFNLGREVYRYVITFNMRPDIASFTIDNENLPFTVNRQTNKILGKANTGFTIQGNFWNTQTFDMTFTSSNSASCNGLLCMVNPATGRTIPYTIQVLDPSRLQEIEVSRSSQTISIDSDSPYQLSSGLFFQFETNNTSLSGTFNDVVTIRAAINLL